MAADPAIDAKSFWRTLGERASGATIVTSLGPDGPAGFLGLSAAHVCAAPPTMLVSIDDRTEALAAVLLSNSFAINYLPSSARELAEIFAGQRALRGAERFEPKSWTKLKTGAPIFNDALGAFDCTVEATHRYGTTTVVVGRVIDLLAMGVGEPLIFFRGKYEI